MITRSFEEEKKFIYEVNEYIYRVAIGFVQNMRVEGYLYLNSPLRELIMEELEQFIEARGVGGFLPAIKQVCNVACLPGIVGVSDT
jgi:tRNA-splicing ligase RtcB